MAYHVLKRGKKFGPFDAQKLQVLANTRQIVQETDIQLEDGRIVKAGQLKGLVFPESLPAIPVPTPPPVKQNNAGISPPPLAVASPAPSQPSVFASTAPPVMMEHSTGPLVHPTMPTPLSGAVQNVQVSTANVHSMSNGDLYTNDDAFASSLNADVYSAQAVPRVALIEGLIRGIPQIIVRSGIIIALLYVIDNIAMWLPESLQESFLDIGVPASLYFLLPFLITIVTAVVTILFQWLSAFNTAIQLTSRNLVVTNGIFSLQETELEFHNIKSVDGKISFVERLFHCGGIQLNMQDGTYILVRYLPSASVKQIRESILRYTARTRTSSR